MKTKTLRLSSIVVASAVLILTITDPTHAGLRFLAKLMILAVVLVSIFSFLIARFLAPDQSRRVFGNLILIGISVSVAMFAAEFGVRVLYRDITSSNDSSSYFSRRWSNLHPPVSNEWGFRERSVSKTKAPGIYRIAVVGDSFTYGQGLRASQRFSNLLQDRLNMSTRSFEVLNFGRPGAETDDHLKTLNETVLQLSPDFILIQWFVNDVEISKADRGATMRLIPSYFLHSWLHSHSAFYNLIELQWTSLQTNLGLAEQYVDNMNRRFADPSSDESLAAAAALELLIRRLKDENIPAGIVLFPMMIDVDGDPDEYPLGFLMDRVLAVCNQQDVPCLDLRPIYAGALSAPDLWANRLDHHPGTAANKLASKAILARFGHIWGITE